MAAGEEALRARPVSADVLVGRPTNIAASAELAPEPPGHALALDANLALMAGAGAGKTHSLITICLHLLGGARADEALRPSQLCLLTFTDKAAAEMRQRLRERVDGLAQGRAGPAEEPELFASFQRHGRPAPPSDFWRKVRDGLGAATIGTFHSFCVKLLRAAPAGFGIDPAFELLEDREARLLVQDTVERVILDALEGGDKLVAELCRELSFGDGDRGLVASLCETYQKIREEGLDTAALPISDPETGRRVFDQALTSLRDWVQRAAGLDLAEEKKFAGCLSRCARALDGMTFDNFLDPARFPELSFCIAAEPSIAKQRKHAELAELLKAIKYAVVGNKKEGVLALSDHYAQVRVHPFEVKVKELLGAVEARHQELLGRRGALDFTALLVKSRDLLREHPQVRAEAQAQVGALLVDEFQDTNRLQLELVGLLAEERAGAPRSLGAAPREVSWPLQPRLLCAVGDRKQSIYEFRGADVSVFSQLAETLTAQGGQVDHLRRNWRSTPSLLQFFNALFARLLVARDGRRYQVAYRPEGDDLLPVRARLREGPHVERLVVSEPDEEAARCRNDDAEAVAAHIRRLLGQSGDPALMVVGKDDAPRKVRGGDIAVLFRRFSFLEVYRQALTRAGVPHRVVRGRGFFGAPEILDVASFLRLVADPEDHLAFAAVLRSPFVAISDASLLRLSVEGGGRLSLREAARSSLSELPAEEGERLFRFLRLYPRLRRERDRLGVRTLVKVALEECGYRVGIAGTPFGEQALVNLDKLLELAGRFDGRGGGGSAVFAAVLSELADAEPTEAQADILDESDVRAVNLLTIHQAKGLEWPVVFVPDLAAQRAPRTGRLLFDRDQGLALRPWIPEQDRSTSGLHFEAVGSELRKREDAEMLRLLYVALTRARDHLVLSGQTQRTAGTWWKLVDDVLAADPALRAMVKDVSVDERPTAVPPQVSDDSPDAAERVAKAVAQVRSALPVSPATAIFPVTQLQNYSLCPRRYFYAHQVGLSEAPMFLELEADEEPSSIGASPRDPRQKGSLAHKLLERCDLSLVRGPPGTLREHLCALLWAEGLEPKEAQAVEIVGWVQRFLSSAFGETLSQVPAERIHRELPFVLRLSGDGPLKVHLRGQIDLLVELPGQRAMVLDYKASKRPPKAAAHYAFQLSCYELAARHHLKEGVTLRSGVVFLREELPVPELLEAAGEDADPGRLNAFERHLTRMAEDLLASARDGDWPGLAKPSCEALRCGYQYRCHAATSA